MTIGRRIGIIVTVGFLLVGGGWLFYPQIEKQSKPRWQMPIGVWNEVYEIIQWGQTWDEIHKHVPGIEPLTAEGGMVGLSSDLQDAKLPILDDSNNGYIEFNFKTGQLYSCYAHLDGLNKKQCQQLYDVVVRQFRNQFGDGQEEQQDEGGYVAKSWFGGDDTTQVSITLGCTGGSHYHIAWGGSKKVISDK